MKFFSNNTDFVAILLFLIVAVQNPIWPIFRIADYLCFVLLTVLFLYLIKKKRFRLQHTAYMFAVLVPIFIIKPIFTGFHFSSILYVLLFGVINLFTREEYNKALELLTKYLFIVILISLPLWFIHVFITPLPSFGEIDLTAQKGSEYFYENHILFVTCSGLEQFRFYSIFDEPGALGTLAAFVLYGNKYDFKNPRLLVILAGAFFTYSLAFFVLTVVGFIISSLNNKIRWIPLLVALTGILLAYNFLKSDETFQTVLLGRLEKNSVEVVGSRTEDSINKYFEEHIFDSEMFFGIGSNGKIEKHFEFGSSYKVFIIEYGWIGLIAMFFMYLIMTKPKNKRTLPSLGFVFLSFIQRPYLLTPWVMILYKMINANNSNRVIERK